MKETSIFYIYIYIYIFLFIVSNVSQNPIQKANMKYLSK